MGDEEERSGSLMVALPVVLTKSHVTMLKSMVTGIGDIDARKQFRLTYPCFSLSNKDTKKHKNDSARHTRWSIKTYLRIKIN